MASPRMLALLGLLAVAGYQNRDKLGDIINRATGGPAAAGVTPPAANNGAAGGLASAFGLGGLFGGNSGPLAANPGGISGALSDLDQSFHRARGQGEAARSWVGTGANAATGSADLEQALGEDTIQTLVQKTGLSRDELLSRLGTVLPQAVDKLTPQGRLPTAEEESRWGTAA